MAEVRDSLRERVEQRLPTVADRISMARQRLQEANSREFRWTRSIPLQGDDSDVLFSYLIDEYERLSGVAKKAGVGPFEPGDKVRHVDDIERGREDVGEVLSWNKQKGFGIVRFPDEVLDCTASVLRAA